MFASQLFGSSFTYIVSLCLPLSHLVPASRVESVCGCLSEFMPLGLPATYIVSLCAASHAKRQGSQRRKLQPRAQLEASSQRKTEPGLCGRMANPKRTTRVPSLFRMRHGVDPQHKEAFARELETIKVLRNVQGMTYCSTPHTSRKKAHTFPLYKREVGRILAVHDVDV